MMMSQIKTIGFNFNPWLPASGKWSTPPNSPHHNDFKKVWFVGWLTTARATPSSGESVGVVEGVWDGISLPHRAREARSAGRSK